MSQKWTNAVLNSRAFDALTLTILLCCGFALLAISLIFAGFMAVGVWTMVEEILYSF